MTVTFNFEDHFRLFLCFGGFILAYIILTYLAFALVKKNLKFNDEKIKKIKMYRLAGLLAVYLGCVVFYFYSYSADHGSTISFAIDLVVWVGVLVLCRRWLIGRRAANTIAFFATFIFFALVFLPGYFFFRNIPDCYNLKSRSKTASCLYSEIARKNDTAYCDVIEKLQEDAQSDADIIVTRESCIARLACFRKDLKLCSLIEVEQLRELCLKCRGQNLVQKMEPNGH